MKKVSILGSTGSIGQSTLSVIQSLSDRFAVSALAAGRDLDKLVTQILRFRPKLVSVSSEGDVPVLRARLRAAAVSIPEIAWGDEGLIEVACGEGTDIVVSATVGAVGFLPTYKALSLGRRVCLANKETLVMAGELMTGAARISGAELLPVDSEHNALHQCLRGERLDEVKRLILTASGGPFREISIEKMREATVKEALNHPTWQMGSKITIDSATLMNKGLEVIEAGWLFGFEPDRISAVVHPQSIVHSMVEMVDGSIIAQLGVTDMRLMIQYALTYPERLPTDLPALRLDQLSRLEFLEPDLERFPCLGLAYDAMRAGGTMPAAMSAANEVAVAAFLDQRIRFMDIPRIIASTMEAHNTEPCSSIESVLEADRWARSHAGSLVGAQKAEVPVHL
ncbi:MAG TPA: 1-deoxy-D-xylulose-5-phosphate reductoisomerase [Blastocatellia bacterium]|jgi:1-deoxy-D-xylulose-5-phosphate reductoisomerase|nr:1-deoxy-D-xylulose-5-phosphate reductoisomerase [Blastocatellia bacterium]